MLDTRSQITVLSDYFGMGIRDRSITEVVLQARLSINRRSSKVGYPVP